ncbi:DUF1963 domain-containing protein [Paenibacillus sp. 19GGS1-52]|uniref:DUF1963 domain-containing protein n=1 Tax=Paenibacillus sp. 19GGS1-52 TaxID=2758563 RepID=UPI001EFB28FA|nr:DUF1963 domain-containing protein [Paenibacillus sp. 19GGS1-52]ULO06217.1 DUF1963 domain-containing protein [Paenibacillus sp. 19GGS1-52]
MSERLPCQTLGCKASILPATALKTGGICMPCHQKKLALEEKAYIEQNRKDVDLYAGVNDPVEILKIMHKPRKYNPLEHEITYQKTAQELYHQLNESDRERLETYAIALMEEDDFGQAETILLSLACFSSARIERGLEVFFRKGKYYPGILYKEASQDIRDKLIHQLEYNSANRNHLLLALAWIGDEEVVRQFETWRQHPPQWASELNTSPESYSHEAGWELDTGGRKKLLYYPESYPLKVCAEGESGMNRAHSAVVVLQSSEYSCPWCGSKLTVLFDYNLQHPLIQYMKLSGQRLRIAACMHCNCYGTVFMKVDLDGGYSWSEYNVVPDFLPENKDIEELSWRAMQLSEQQMGTYEHAFWTLEAPATQIGGHPAWIQDAEYPVCPCCSVTMKFIAQIDMEQVEFSEGIYYIYLCEACLIVAVNYQQT